MKFSPSQIIVLATPVFLAMLAVELAWGHFRKRNTYRLNDAALWAVGAVMQGRIGMTPGNRRARPRGRAAVGVAVGAVLFMLSDALLAIDRFAQPLPMAQFWVLATYYAAQVLIVRNGTQAALAAQLSNSSPAFFGGTTPRWR